MKALMILLTGASLLLLRPAGLTAQEEANKPAPDNAEKGDAKAQLQELVQVIQAKLQTGAKAESDFPEEIKQFDALLEEHKGEKTDEVAQILVMKAMLYAQVFDDPEKALPLLRQLKTDFPESSQAERVEPMLEQLATQIEGAKIRKQLVIGATFPDWDEKDLNGNPLTVSQFKGKVVLIDFWATWCGPCIQELPNVLRTYEKYHDKGFEIIGVSLDRTEEKLTSFIRQEKMTWPQFFDGKAWQSKLAIRYGVQSIPATYLLDKEGKIVAKDLRGPALAAAVGDLIAK